MDGSLYKIGIIEAKMRYIWMTIADCKKVDGLLEQWLKDTIPWTRAQHGLKAFLFQTDNGEFASKSCRDLVATQGGILITNNAPYSPETMSIIERSWRTIGEMSSVMLIHSGVAQSFWEEATLYAVDIYSRVPPAKANRAGILTSLYEILHGAKPLLDDLRPFGCRGFALIPASGKSHKARS